MARTIYDVPEVIATGRPIDRTAALVLNRGPKGLESAKRITQIVSPTALRWCGLTHEHRRTGVPDLTGMTVGNLTVMGLWRDQQDGKNGLLWVCRCVCGWYVTRKAKAIRNPKNAGDCCERCRQVVFLKRQSLLRDLGFYKTEPGSEAARLVQEDVDRILGLPFQQ